MIHREAPHCPRRLSGESGGAVVEAALVVPFLALVVLGLVEYGTAWTRQNLLIRSTQSSARTAATQATDRYADYNAIKSIEGSLAPLRNGAIERVVLYRSDKPDGGVPAACKDVTIVDDLSAKGSTAAACNIYSAAQVGNADAVLSHFGGGTAGCDGSAWDRFWCPTDRSRGGDTSDPDYLGVYVKVAYSPLTGIAGSPDSIEADVVYRLDPCITGVSCD
jgi:hypothetical protein